jgi:ribosomal protein L37E
MNLVQQWLQKIAGKRETLRQEPPREPVDPNIAAHVLDVWLEQVASLKHLRMHDHADRKLSLARAITLESMQDAPSDPMVWVNIGRVQLADEKFEEATKAFEHARSLANQQGNAAIEGFAGSGLFQVRRRQAAAHEAAPLDLPQPLTQEQYQQFLREKLDQMFYVCQGCGQLNLMAGEHCAHCRFAPKTLEQSRLSITLSRVYFKTQALLQIALNLQRGKNPFDCIVGLDAVVQNIQSDQGILQKIEDNREDDHLNFKALDRCASCGIKVWSSSAEVCTHCHQSLDRPVLLRLAICVERLCNQWIWTVHTSESKAFEQFVLLLVNMKYQLIRQQMGPSDAQRHNATGLLLQLSPLYTQNMGGVVRIKNPTKVVSEVIDPSVHQDVGPTVDYLRDELKHFLHLMSDSVSLF